MQRRSKGWHLDLLYGYKQKHFFDSIIKVRQIRINHSINIRMISDSFAPVKLVVKGSRLLGVARALSKPLTT
jgi:hypothetical protein